MQRLRRLIAWGDRPGDRRLRSPSPCALPADSCDKVSQEILCRVASVNNDGKEGCLMSPSRLLGGLAAAVAALIVVAPVTAGPPATGSGTGTIGIRAVTPVKTSGGNVFQE